MPYSNFCKKCKLETPLGDACPRCGSKLTKAGERLSFRVERVPVTDWFCWNAMLRVIVPVIGLVFTVTLLVEGVLEGARGIQQVFVQGFFWILMAAFGALLLTILLLLALQGAENVCYVLDAKGAHAYVYLAQPKPWKLYARLMSPGIAAAMQNEAPETPPKGQLYVKRADILWPMVKRVKIWPETCTIMLFNPTFWQALSIRCNAAEFQQASELIAKKAPRKKQARKKRK